MAVSVEQVKDAADVVDALCGEEAWREIPHEGTHWLGAARQLRKLAEARTPKPWKPKVYVEYDEQDTAVYVEKTDGKFVSVYIGSAYDDDGRAGSDHIDNLTGARGTLVFGG